MSSIAAQVEALSPRVGLAEAIKLAQEAGMTINFSSLNGEEADMLKHSFNRYIDTAFSQMPNVNRTIRNPVRAVAFQLAILVREDRKQLEGLGLRDEKFFATKA